MKNSCGGLWVVVPVKRFSTAKGRLKDTLDPLTRAELSRAMLEDVLTALSETSDLAGIRLVSADASAAELGRRFGAQTTVDRREAGTSAAIDQGIASLPDGWGGVLAMPSDIPFITPAEITQIIGPVMGQAVVIVPAERDGGTNALAMSSSAQIELCFGPSSFVRHVAAARAALLEPTIMRMAGAGYDIDVESDLFAWNEVGRGTRTRLLLERIAPACGVKRGAE